MYPDRDGTPIKIYDKVEVLVGTGAGKLAQVILLGKSFRGDNTRKSIAAKDGVAVRFDPHSLSYIYHSTDLLVV